MTAAAGRAASAATHAALPHARVPALAMLLPVTMWLCTRAAAGDAPAARERTELALTPSQQQAVGIRIEHPLPLSTAPQIEAYGTILDPISLVTDMGRVESTRVAAAAAAAEAERLERLYHEDTVASLKSLQAAQAQAAEAAAQARAAALNFSMQWGPLASWSAARRRSLRQAVAEGRSLLLRADVPAQHLGSAIEQHAVVEVDGVNLTALVLGQLPRADGPVQSAAWLLQLERAPQGLGPGARAAVRLQAAAAAGLLVPGEALVYAQQGTYVYRRESAPGANTFHYVAVAVRPLTRVGNAWLVDGLAPADQVVVQGAGVLWSLQGIGQFSAAEEEHD
jgi:hypothetical protein